MHQFDLVRGKSQNRDGYDAFLPSFNHMATEL